MSSGSGSGEPTVWERMITDLSRTGWRQGPFPADDQQVNPGDDDPVCLRESLWRVSGMLGYWERQEPRDHDAVVAWEADVDAMEEACMTRHGKAVVPWNDDPATSYEDVVLFLKDLDAAELERRAQRRGA